MPQILPLVNPSACRDGTSRVSTRTTLAPAVFVEPRQFPAKKRIVGKVSLQPHQEFARARQVFLADVGDGQQDAREWGQQMALRCGLLEFGNAASLISRHAPEAQEPAHWSSHRSDDVTADAACQVSIIATRIDREQLLRPGGCLLEIGRASCRERM